MHGRISAYPWSNFFLLTEFQCLVKIFSITCKLIEGSSTQFHIIHPIILLIKIAGFHRSCLRHARLGQSKLESRDRFLLQDFSVRRIFFLKQRRSQSKGTGKFSRCRRSPCCPVFIFSQSLYLAGDKINRSAISFTLTIISRIIGGQPEPDMVTVVGQLIKHPIIFRMHF